MRKVMFGYKGILLSVFLVFLLAMNTQAAVEWGVEPGDWASWTWTAKDEEGRTLGSIEKAITAKVTSVNPDDTITVEFKMFGSTDTDTWSATENLWIVAKSELETAEQQNKGLAIAGADPTSAVEKKDYNYQGKINGESVDKTMNAYTCTFSDPDYTGEYWWDQKAGILYEGKSKSKRTKIEYCITLEDTNASLSEKTEEVLCPFTITVATIPVTAFFILEAKKRKME